MISNQFQLISKDVFPHEKDFLILPERILVEVTILAISPRISMLLGSAPLQPLLNLPVWSTLLPLVSILPNPSLPDCKYLPPFGFFNCFVRFKCTLPLRRRVISARVNLCSGENDLGCKSKPNGDFSNIFPPCGGLHFHFPPAPHTSAYLLQSTEGVWGSRRGFSGR